MQSAIDCSANTKNIVECKEVKFPDKSYSKLVTPDGQVAILYSPHYGGGWSTSVFNDISPKHQLIFDSRIIVSLFSPGMRWSEKEYTEFMYSVFSDGKFFHMPDFSTYKKKLKVKFIPEKTIFRINEYDGYESIEIYKPSSYFTS